MNSTLLSTALQAINPETTTKQSMPRKFAIEGTEVDGRLFKNPLFSLHITNPDQFNISSVGATNSFADMQKARKPEANTLSVNDVLSEMSQGAGKTLSNIGISVALTTTIDGERYALMQYRERDNRHMLLSGYVDAHQENQAIESARALMVSHCLEEIQQEFVPVTPPGELVTGLASGKIINELLSELVVGSTAATSEEQSYLLKNPYQETMQSNSNISWTITQNEIPAFIPNINRNAQVLFDNQPVSKAGIQYATQWNAGQLFTSYEVTLPQVENLSLFHAEDGPKQGGAPYELQTSLNLDGLVLVKLDENEQLTDKTYWLRNGSLIHREAFNADNIKLSEAFSAPADPSGRILGIVNQNDITFNEYRKLIS